MNFVQDLLLVVSTVCLTRGSKSCSGQDDYGQSLIQYVKLTAFEGGVTQGVAKSAIGKFLSSTNLTELRRFMEMVK